MKALFDDGEGEVPWVMFSIAAEMLLLGRVHASAASGAVSILQDREGRTDAAPY
jgi:hypothetical protein